MAAEQRVSIKLVVEKENNRLVYAESYQDFVDLLFSFLTLPMGRIIGRLRMHSSCCGLGCISKLYSGVGNLSETHLRTKACKTMLLHPKIPSIAKCSKLKLEIDPFDRYYKQFYVCGTFSARCRLGTSYLATCSCGLSYDRWANVKDREPYSVPQGDDGAFVKGGLAQRYVISDDLQVMAGSISTCMFMLGKRQIGDVRETEERIVTAGWEEISELLCRSWCSQTPLTDVFLSKQGALDVVKIEPHALGLTECTKEKPTDKVEKKFKVKLILRKSTDEVLYAEAEHDLVDQLFSFFTFPLGLVLNLFGGKRFLKGCFHNIYGSVFQLSSNGFMKSKECETLLVRPKLASHFGCENQLLCIEEEEHPRYNCTVIEGDLYNFNLTEVDASSSNGKKSSLSSLVMDGLMAMNPKSPFPDDKVGGGYVKEPSKFMITDDLVVTPLSHTSCLFFLSGLNVSFDELEERFVDVGREEVLNLLKASLISDTALRTLVEKRGTQ